MLNPYEPFVASKEKLLRDDPPSRISVSLLAFMPGAIIGLHVGSSVEQGIAATVQRTMVNPLNSAIFLSTFAVAVLALTFVYRLPRWLIVGSHRIFWWSAFLSGTIVVGFGLSTVVILERFSFIKTPAPPFSFGFLAIGLVIAISVAIGVELEAHFSRVEKF